MSVPMPSCHAAGSWTANCIVKVELGSVGTEMNPESDRLAFIAKRNGIGAARQWAERTLRIYREAVQNSKSHGSLPGYRGKYLASIHEMEDWLEHDGESN
jgi:hypothetical protein